MRYYSIIELTKNIKYAKVTAIVWNQDFRDYPDCQDCLFFKRFSMTEKNIKPEAENSGQTPDTTAFLARYKMTLEEESNPSDETGADIESIGKRLGLDHETADVLISPIIAYFRGRIITDGFGSDHAQRREKEKEVIGDARQINDRFAKQIEDLLANSLLGLNAIGKVYQTLPFLTDFLKKDTDEAEKLAKGIKDIAETLPWLDLYKTGYGGFSRAYNQLTTEERKNFANQIKEVCIRFLSLFKEEKKNI